MRRSRARLNRVRGASALFFLCLTAFGPSQATAGDAARPVRSLAEIRQQGIVMQRWDKSCGAAALATLLTYDLNDPVTELTVATAMLRRTSPTRVRVRGGFSLLDMQDFAEGRGYQADGYGEMTLDSLRTMLPAIVPLSLHGYDHFVIVRAIGSEDVVMADPAFGKRRLRIDKFEKAWVQKVAFVVSRADQ